MRRTSMFVHSRDMVSQKARRKGRTLEGGRMATRSARDCASAACGRGRSDIHMQKKRPFQSFRSSIWGRSRRPERKVWRERRALSRVGLSVECTVSFW